VSRRLDVSCRQHGCHFVHFRSVLQRWKRRRHCLPTGILLQHASCPGSVSCWLSVRWKYHKPHAVRPFAILPHGNRRCSSLRSGNVLSNPVRQRYVHSRFLLPIWEHSSSSMRAGFVLSKRNGSDHVPGRNIVQRKQHGADKLHSGPILRCK
jgi:hypothetical protein